MVDLTVHIFFHYCLGKLWAPLPILLLITEEAVAPAFIWFSHVFEFALQIRHFLAQTTAPIINIASGACTLSNSPDCKRRLSRRHLLADSSILLPCKPLYQLARFGSDLNQIGLIQTPKFDRNLSHFPFWQPLSDQPFLFLFACTSTSIFTNMV